MVQAPCVTVAPALVLQTWRSEERFCVGDVIIKPTAVGRSRSSPAVTLAKARTNALPLESPRPVAHSHWMGSRHLPQQSSSPKSCRIPPQSRIQPASGLKFIIPAQPRWTLTAWTIRDDRSDFHLIANGGPLLVTPGRLSCAGQEPDQGQGCCENLSANGPSAASNQSSH